MNQQESGPRLQLTKQEILQKLKERLVQKRLQEALQPRDIVPPQESFIHEEKDVGSPKQQQQRESSNSSEQIAKDIVLLPSQTEILTQGQATTPRWLNDLYFMEEDEVLPVSIVVKDSKVATLTSSLKKSQQIESKGTKRVRFDLQQEEDKKEENQSSEQWIDHRGLPVPTEEACEESLIKRVWKSLSQVWKGSPFDIGPSNEEEADIESRMCKTLSKQEELLNTAKASTSLEITTTFRNWLNKYSKAVNVLELIIFVAHRLQFWQLKQLLVQLRQSSFASFQLLWALLYLFDNSTLLSHQAQAIAQQTSALPASYDSSTFYNKSNYYNSNYNYSGYHDGYNNPMDMHDTPLLPHFSV